MRLMRKLLPLLYIILFVFSCRKEETNPESLPNSYSDQAVGKSANDLLSSNTYATLNVQIQYMSGYEFDSAAISALTTYLNGICNKTGGITITQQPIAANGDTLNVGQVAVIEAQNRSAYTNDHTISVYVIITDGYDTSGYVLGFAYRNTSICLFGGDIFTNSGGTGQITRLALETSLLEHEFGHLMGLVNLGTPMLLPHQDTVHGNHCTNPNCLMYYAIDTHDAFVSLANKVPTLDSNCLNDLRGNGGK